MRRNGEAKRRRKVLCRKELEMFDQVRSETGGEAIDGTTEFAESTEKEKRDK